MRAIGWHSLLPNLYMQRAINIIVIITIIIIILKVITTIKDIIIITMAAAGIIEAINVVEEDTVTNEAIP